MPTIEIVQVSGSPKESDLGDDLPPPNKTDKLVQNTLTLRPDHWAWLDQLARERGTNRSEVARAIFDAYRAPAAKPKR